MSETPTENGASVQVVSPEPGVALVTINRPRVRNALDVATVAALGKAMREADADPKIRAIVLTGAGGAFCAGSDIKEMLRVGISCLHNDARVEGWQALETIATPWIAAIDGLALGAGLELALLADIILCSESARFGFPEVKIGVMPGDGGSQRLPRLIGRQAALRMILTGDVLTADEAVQLGLAVKTEEGAGAVETAISMAARIAANAPLATKQAKAAVTLGLEEPLANGLKREARGLAALFATHDQQEGMRAFAEKRTPAFKGF